MGSGSPSIVQLKVDLDGDLNSNRFSAFCSRFESPSLDRFDGIFA